MGNAHAITEHSEQRLLAGHQVCLQHVLADGLASVKLERLVDPCILIGQGLFLDENRPQLAIASQCGDCGFINILIVGAEPIEHLSDKGGIDCGVEFVRFHEVGKIRWPRVNSLILLVARAERKEFLAIHDSELGPISPSTGGGYCKVQLSHLIFKAWALLLAQITLQSPEELRKSLR